jgi:hypothetical protein
MLADPQSVTLAGSAVSLPRTSTTTTGAVYSAPDSTIKLDVVHNIGRRNRTTVRLRQDKIAADPLIASTNRRLSATAYMGIDVPPEGFTVAEQVALVKALSDWLTASTMANTTKVVGGES